MLRIVKVAPLPILLLSISIFSSSPAVSMADREVAVEGGEPSKAAVHIVYAEKPEGDEPEVFHLRTLATVLGSEEAAKESLLYVYKNATTGFSAKLTPEQVAELSREAFSDVVGSPYYVAPEVLHKHYGPEVDVWSAGVILYILLSGVPPFWAETESGIFRQILQGKLDFVSDPWPSISDSAKDLIKKMLERDPRKRLTAHEVLCHPWIVDDGAAPDKPLDSAVLSRLKQFSAMNKLKKMALRVIAERLSEEEIGGLKELFKMIDTDNSGSITFEELKDGLKRVGSNLTVSEIRDVMDAADIDNSGTIDYGEFLAATLHLNKMEREENLGAAFSYFDKDGSGYITFDELQQDCKDFGLSNVRRDEIIKEIDQDNMAFGGRSLPVQYLAALFLFLFLFGGMPVFASANLTLVHYNNCPIPIFPSLIPSGSMKIENSISFGAIYPSEVQNYTLPDGWAGLGFFGTGCTLDGSSAHNCTTGNCKGRGCAEEDSPVATTYIISDDGNLTMSTDRGYNLALEIMPICVGCRSTSCKAQLENCQNDLRLVNSNGAVVGCKPPGKGLQFSQSQCIIPGDYSVSTVRIACPHKTMRLQSCRENSGDHTQLRKVIRQILQIQD